jgi:hypothetical protein
LKSLEKLPDQLKCNPEYPKDQLNKIIRFFKEYKPEFEMDTLPEYFKHLSKDEFEAIIRQDDFYENFIKKVFAKAQKKLENMDIHNLRANELDDLMVCFLLASFLLTGLANVSYSNNYMRVFNMAKIPS